LEGLNSVLQAAKRKARGYKMQHFKTIAYLLTGKLDFSKKNTSTQFTFIKRLTQPIAFNDSRQIKLSDLISGKALFTGHAFTPTSHLITLIR
jgi:hypothetical protein